MSRPTLLNTPAGQIPLGASAPSASWILGILVSRAWVVLAGGLLIGLLTFAATFLFPPVYTARTSFLPPHMQQSATASALASLGALAGIAGAAASRSPADQYVALMESELVADRIVDRFDLMRIYESKFRVDARNTLNRNVRISVGKKDGFIQVEVEDEDPARAAAIANQHVEELRRLTGSLALSEAQQRRAFFETLLTQTRQRLTEAQRQLEASGFSAGALRAEPKAAAENYANLRAEITAAEVRLQTLRRSLSDTAPEVLQQETLLTALRAQLAQIERPPPDTKGADYVGRYREFKYQESLFELLSRQYEIARVDEAREGALIQVIDAARPPERRSRPKRVMSGVAGSLLGLLVVGCGIVLREWRRSSTAPLPSA